MSLKMTIRGAINRSPVARRWFVSGAARFSMRLFALQAFLSVDELRAKLRGLLWRRVIRMSITPNVEKVVLQAGRATFYYADGCAFHAVAGKTSLSSSQYSHGDYETFESRLMAQVVSRGWTAVDAGANFGWHAVHLARWVGPEGRVIAFEPIPQSFLELSENRDLNGCENLEIVNAALGSVEGPVTFYLPPIHLGGGAASEFLDIGEKVQVPMRRLDSVLEQRGIARVDFVKADVEGGELNLLRGAERLFERCRPAILIENVDIHCQRFGHTPQDVVRFLKERGYLGKYIDRRGELVSFDENQPPNGNFYFTPAGRDA
jgi:FkbM family methyltransferase